MIFRFVRSSHEQPVKRHPPSPKKPGQVLADPGRGPQSVKPLFDGTSLALYHWSPPPQHAYANFGDEISPLLVKRMLDRNGNNDVSVMLPEPGRAKLLAIGSILQLARNGDVVWGAGVNAKTWVRNLETNKLIDVRLVRGPLTKAAILQHGITCPDRFGDPVLAFPMLFQQEIDAAAEVAGERFPNAKVLYIPNLNDERFADQRQVQNDPRVSYLSPGEDPFVIAHLISRAEVVISSSLHGLVLADAFGVPSRPVLSWFEPLFKYLDYYAGTGRVAIQFARDYVDALVGEDTPVAEFDVAQILSSFPNDIVSNDRH